jgi:hypothetical protein
MGPIPEFHIGLIPGWKALQLDFSEALHCVFEAPFSVGTERAGITMRHMATMPTKAKDFIVNFMVLLTSKNDPSYVQRAVLQLAYYLER